MKHPLMRHVAAFMLSVVLALGFLLLGACLPQQPIDANVLASAEAMVEDGSYPLMADKSFASMLDVTTDALILAESKATTIRHPETILTNPRFDGRSDTVSDLLAYASDDTMQPTGYYVQYWMGFRPVIRLLLCFLDYYQILRYTAVAFFLLFAAVMCSLAKRAGTGAAFLFALSIIFVRPHVIAVSLQFSCCFLIAFAAMLLVPKIHKNRKWESLFFLELGIVTQYFDFYTTPIVTFGLPMLYLYLLGCREQDAPGGKRIGTNVAAWLAGYGLMWLAKLALTSLLTDANGLGQGLSAFAGRVGIEKTPGMESYYNPLAAIRAVFVSLYSDREGKLILFAAVAIAFVLLAYRFLKDRHTLREAAKHWQLVFIAALPVIWFMLSAQPTVNHHWFQYRGIAVSFWAALLWLQFLLQRKPDPLAE